MSAARAGDFDYDTHGHGYATVRRPDPCIAAHVHNALGDARTVLNVGTGAGSYQPADRTSQPLKPPPPCAPNAPRRRSGHRRELRRVAHGPVVVLAFDGDALDLLWLSHYAPQLIAHRTPPPRPAGPGGPVSLGFVDDADEAPASPGSPPTWNPGCGRMALGRRARRTHPGRYHRRLEPALASGAAGVGRIDEVRRDADAAEQT